MNIPYLVSLFVHILTAITFLGGMLFLIMVLVPMTRKPEYENLAGKVLGYSARKFGRIGGISLVLLIITGFTNAMFKGFGMAVFSGAFWSSTYAHTMGTKLIIAVVIAGLGFMHTAKAGERALQAMEGEPGASETKLLRRSSSITGRISLLLSVLAVLLGIMMSRGFLP